MKDVIEYLDEHPEIRAINNDSERNEGLAKSLKNDKVIELKTHIKR